ncbi:hypothetical protein SAY87_021729 [Trapa incisa]|uniref:Uncharacterized protein n=1 Tax=Trapa incisa TaxID=236973 RepID=A0AAN7JS43_9MYRT|nr:hypothetical protein SAY87_021729 [Trapa incisa]
MGKKLHTKQGKKSRIGDQNISRCTSKNAASKREENVVNSGSVERKKKKKRKHDSGGIGIDVENKRNGRKKRKVEQYIDQEKELDKPLEKDKKSRPEKGSYAFHLTSDDSNGRVTRKKYNKKDPSACGDDYDIPSESEGLKSKKRKKEHKHNLADDDTEAGLGEGGAIMEVPPKKKDYSKQGEVGNDGYGSKKEKRSNINKQEKKKHKKKTEQSMNKKGDNEVESTDKLAIKSARKVRFSDTVEYFPQKRRKCRRKRSTGEG